MVCWALQSGWTALIWAVFSGKVDAVALLLDRGADPEIRDKVSHSPLGIGLAILRPRAERPIANSCAFLSACQDNLSGDGSRVRFACAATAFATLAIAFPLSLRGGCDAVLQDGQSALDRCSSDTCRSVLLGAERLQRWHRRRLLVTWLH